MAGLSAERVRRIESLVTDWLADCDVPGASVVVFDADGERYADGFGARDLGTNAPATPETVYGMGSISKSVTALAVCRLAADGSLAVDDHVGDYVDHFAAAPGGPITVAELLSHTSGLPAADPGLLTQAIHGLPAGVADRDDFERFVRGSTDARVTDEERFFYYNTGYDVLGEVVEAVDGRPYADYVADEILAPLGMARSGFGREALDAADDAMTGYMPGDETPERTDPPFDPLMFPAGGLVSSPRELARFYRAMLSGGALAGTRVCDQETVDRLHEPRAVRQTYLDGSEETYGFGWMRHPVGDDLAVGHGGSIGVSTAYGGYLLDAGVGVVVACNTTADPHPIDVGQAVLAIATGQDRTVVPTYALREKCRAVTGRYATFDDGLTATVEADAGGLSLSFSGPWNDAETTAFPETLAADDHGFYTVDGDGARIPVEFRVRDDGVDLFYRRNRLRRTGDVAPQ